MRTGSLRTLCTTAGRTVTPSSYYDFLVCGGGIVGVNVATVLKMLNPDAKILIVEKEDEVGLHASGRNSGVIHAGFYYAADSLKAKLTRAGNVFMHDYCRSKGIPVLNCGKLVVAKNEAELGDLDTLFRRAELNSVPVEEITESQAKRIEPKVRTHKAALWSPTTSVSDPCAVLQHQLRDAVQLGVELALGCKVAHVEKTNEGSIDVVDVHVSGVSKTLSRQHANVHSGVVRTRHFVNAAGLYADKIAKQLGFAQTLSILPFIGLYMYCDVDINTLVYPVPELSRPFLGVHFTKTINGKVKIGPTAIPALWREQYPEAGWLKTVSLPEVTEIARTALPLLAQSSFRRLAAEELRKYSRRYMIEGAAVLLDGVTDHIFKQYGRAGIRAQLVDTRRHDLHMDFHVEGDNTSTHILNAVSPAWTSSRPFAELVCSGIQQRTSGLH